MGCKNTHSIHDNPPYLRSCGSGGPGGIRPAEAPTPPDVRFSASGGWRPARSTERGLMAFPSAPLTLLSVIGPCADEVSLPMSSLRRYCRRGQQGSRCVWRGYRYGQLTSGRIFPLRNVPYSFVWFLRPFAPSGFHRRSSLLRPLLTPLALSGRRSPRVSALTFLPGQPALPGAPSMDLDFAFPSTLVARTRPHCRFVFLWSGVCLQLLSATTSRPLPCCSATVTSICSDQLLSSD